MKARYIANLLYRHYNSCLLEVSRRGRSRYIHLDLFVAGVQQSQWDDKGNEIVIAYEVKQSPSLIL
jgi:hypothetical protein